MNMIGPEGEPTHKDGLCLRVISVFMTGRHPPFISPPQVNARPVHAFLSQHVAVGGPEVLEDTDSHGTAREHDMCRFRPLE
jgi:hypothetical protein